MQGVRVQHSWQSCDSLTENVGSDWLFDSPSTQGPRGQVGHSLPSGSTQVPEQA